MISSSPYKRIYFAISSMSISISLLMKAPIAFFRPRGTLKKEAFL